MILIQAYDKLVRNVQNIHRLFNKNSIPFFILTLFHFGIVLLMLKKRKKKGFWGLLFTNIGFAYLFEYPTFNLFHGYRYIPHILKKRPFDNVFGAILSQGIYVPIVATFLTIFQKNWRWKISFSFFYFLIEHLFLRIKIYKVYWWKPRYTLIFISLYFFVSDFIYKMLAAPKKWAYVLANFQATQVTWVNIMFVYALFRQIRFGRGRYHTWTEHFNLIPLYSLVLSLIASITSKKAIINRFLLIGSHYILDKFLIKKGILKLKFKHVFYHLGWYTIMPFMTRLLKRVINGQPKESTF